jgi:hypothetical protein
VVLHAELGMNAQANLMRPLQVPTPEERPPMHEDDAAICDPTYATPAHELAARVEQLRPYEWMVFTQYADPDEFQEVYGKNDGSADNARRIRARLEELERQYDGNTASERIKLGFSAVCDESAKVSHPTKKDLRPRRVLDVVPGAALAGLRYFVMKFDAHPDDAVERTRKGLAPVASEAVREARTCRGLLRVPDEEEEESAAHVGAYKSQYYAPESLPASSSAEAAWRVEGSEHVYRHVREYKVGFDEYREGADAFLVVEDGETETAALVGLSGKLDLQQSSMAAGAVSDSALPDAVVTRRGMTETEAEELAHHAARYDMR